MVHDHSHHQGNGGPQGSFWTSRTFLVFLAFAAIAIVLLWEEHRAHILGALPYLFLLACPLLHFFHGHGGGHSHGGGTAGSRSVNDNGGGKP